MDTVVKARVMNVTKVHSLEMFGILADMAIQLIHSLLGVFVKLEGLNHHREVKTEAVPCQS